MTHYLFHAAIARPHDDGGARTRAAQGEAHLPVLDEPALRQRPLLVTPRVVTRVKTHRALSDVSHRVQAPSSLLQ